MGINFNLEHITPQLAKQYLEKNAENQRPKKALKIAAYAEDMKNGDWKLTGEAIKFDVSGKLIDGQNRLHAVVESGAVVPIYVARGVTPEAMLVMDTGAARTFADNLIVEGASDRMRSAGIIRWIMGWENKNYALSGGNKNTFTHTQLRQRYLKDPGLFDSAALRGRDMQNHRLGNGAACGVAFFLFSQISEREAKIFFDHVITGANLPFRHPALTLRNKLSRIKEDRLSRAEVLACYIRGWNSFRVSRDLDTIVIVPKGKLNNSNFPMPR